jgi:hypothetical protein
VSQSIRLGVEDGGAAVPLRAAGKRDLKRLDAWMARRAGAARARERIVLGPRLVAQ